MEEALDRIPSTTLHPAYQPIVTKLIASITMLPLRLQVRFLHQLKHSFLPILVRALKILSSNGIFYNDISTIFKFCKSR